MVLFKFTSFNFVFYFNINSPIFLTSSPLFPTLRVPCPRTIRNASQFKLRGVQNISVYSLSNKRFENTCCSSNKYFFTSSQFQSTYIFGVGSNSASSKKTKLLAMWYGLGGLSWNFKYKESNRNFQVNLPVNFSAYKSIKSFLHHVEKLRSISSERYPWIKLTDTPQTVRADSTF